MFNNKSSLTTDEIKKLYALRWELITKKVYIEKWEGFIGQNNITAYEDILNSNPGSFSAETKIFNLSESISKNNTAILEILLRDFKVDPNIFLANESPLHLAMTLQHQDCAELLMKYGAMLTVEEMKAINNNNKKAVSDIEKVEEKKEEITKDKDSFDDYLLNGFNNANANKSNMLQRFIKTNELKAAKILISKNILLNEEQIDDLDGAQKVIYSELLANNENLAELAGDVNVLEEHC